MKKSRIEICDSRRLKGQYFVRLVAGNGEKLSTSETLESVGAVNKNLVAQAKIFTLTSLITSQGVFDNVPVVDRTKGGYWSKKYGVLHVGVKGVGGK